MRRWAVIVGAMTCAGLVLGAALTLAAPDGRRSLPTLPRATRSSRSPSRGPRRPRPSSSGFLAGSRPGSRARSAAMDKVARDDGRRGRRRVASPLVERCGRGGRRPATDVSDPDRRRGRRPGDASPHSCRRPTGARVAALAEGEGILGATSADAARARTRRRCSTIGGRRIRIAAVLPDELVGAAELVVSARTGARIGITHDRYFLVQPGRRPPADRRRVPRAAPTAVAHDARRQPRGAGPCPGPDAVLPGRRCGAAAGHRQEPVRRVRGATGRRPGHDRDRPGVDGVAPGDDERARPRPHHVQPRHRRSAAPRDDAGRGRRPRRTP